MLAASSKVGTKLDTPVTVALSESRSRVRSTAYRGVRSGLVQLYHSAPYDGEDLWWTYHVALRYSKPQNYK